METKLELAVQEYRKRQSREKHPDGRFDNGGRWYPSRDEEQECCSSIRSPSRSYPYSLMVHCRTIQHIAVLFGVDEKELRQEVMVKSPAKREGGDDYFKLVAINPKTGEMVSIFDGETIYRIGERLNGKARQGHKGGYYCYAQMEDAKLAEYPHSSVGADWEKVLLRVRGEGQYCIYQSDIYEPRKIAFSAVTPLGVTAD